MRGLLFVGLLVLFQAVSAEESPGGRFDFHASQWVALHHTAYHLERAERTDLKLRGRVPLHPDDDPALAREFLTGCPEIATAYAPYVATSILFSPDTRRIAKELADGPDALTDRRVAEALEACMPVYERTLWPIHKASARAFIERVQAELAEYEDAVAAFIAEDLNIVWPDTPVRVDVVPYANWAGAYTDIDPANVTFSSRNDRLSGKYAMEMLFHEAGHTPPIDTAITAASEAAMKATGLHNKRFSHYVLFHTIGHAVEQIRADEDYLAYVHATGLSQTDGEREIYDALSAVWKNGEDLDERVRQAAERVVAARSAKE